MHLNLPEFKFQIKKGVSGYTIFDEIRLKWIKLTPEEWVRQNFIKYLIENKNYPKTRISVEENIKVNNQNRRCDILIYSESFAPILVVECKAHNIELNQNVFDQIIRYNLELNLSHLIITNGLSHYYINKNGYKYNYLNTIPSYETICN